MAAREDDEGAMPHSGNGDGNGRYGEGASARRAPPTLPTWPRNASFDDVKVVVANTLSYLHECLPEMVKDIDATKGFALAASGHAARAADAVEKLTERLDDNEGMLRKKLESVPDLGEVEEVARKAARDAAESTGAQHIADIMKARDFEDAKKVLANIEKQQAEKDARKGKFWLAIVTGIVLFLTEEAIRWAAHGVHF